MSKKILILARNAPYGSSLAREAVDFVLTSAAYDQDISILFSGDGVFQLLENQQTNKSVQKNHLSAMEVFPLYDINQLYVIQEDLEARNIDKDRLGMDVIMVSKQDAHALMQQQDSIIGF